MIKKSARDIQPGDIFWNFTVLYQAPNKSGRRAWRNTKVLSHGRWSYRKCRVLLESLFGKILCKIKITFR